MASRDLKVNVHYESHENDLKHTIIIYVNDHPSMLLEEDTGIAYDIVRRDHHETMG